MLINEGFSRGIAQKRQERKHVPLLIKEKGEMAIVDLQKIKVLNKIIAVVFINNNTLTSMKL